MGGMRCASLGLVLLSLACSGRFGSGADDGATSETSGTSGTGGTGTSGTGTSGTSETGTSETGGTSTSTSTSTGADGPRFDLGVLPDANPDFDPQPCPAAVVGTSVSGETPLGAFAGTRAWFGGDESYLRLIIFDDAADVDAEAEYAHYNHGELWEGPAIIIEANPYLGIPKTEPVAILAFSAPDAEAFMGELSLDELVLDDNDQPTLLRGSIALWPDQDADGVVGTFEAGLCPNFTQMFWGE